MRRRTFRSQHNERAMVLIAALLVLVLLATVVAEIGYTGALLTNSARTKTRRATVRLGLESGMAAIRQVIPTKSDMIRDNLDSITAFFTAAFTIGGCTVNTLACPAVMISQETIDDTEPELLSDFRERVSLNGWHDYLQGCKLNVNTTSQALMQERFPDVDATLFHKIVQRQKMRPFRKLEELKEVPGMTEGIYVRLVNNLDVIDRDFLILCRSSQGRHASWLVSILRVEEDTTTVGATIILDE